MKKGKKAAIIIIAVIAAAAIVVGGLMIGGVIPTGNKRTASAKEITVDDTAMVAYKSYPKVYKTTLRSLYGMSENDVAKVYENNCDGWNVYNQTVAIKNRSNIAIVISNAKSDANGTDNIWVSSRRDRNLYIQCPRQGLQQPRRCEIGSQEAQSEHRVCGEQVRCGSDLREV